VLDLALIGSAALLGAAGMAHCTAMCGAACAALTGGTGNAGAVPARTATLGFHLARVTSYALGGAVAAASMGALASLAQWSPALRPFWTLLHVAALGLGIFLLWRGRQPAWMAAIGRGAGPQRAAPPATAGGAGDPGAAVLAGGWQRVRVLPRVPAKAVLAGGLWVAWPCGLLQSALLVAAMANTPWGGGAAMAAFAITSSGGLLLAPWAWRRWGAKPQAQTLAVRAAGLMLAGASAFALLHGLWPAFAAFCATL
jgi:sulfite exporter TauE/SafE